MAELGVFGIGVATADPELKVVGTNNSSVCTVNLAFNRSFKDKNDKWQSEPCFLRAQIWGNRADRMAETVRKGQPMYVHGYMKQDTWEKDGRKRVAYSINLKDFQLCTKNNSKKQSTQDVKETVPDSSSADSGDLPF